MKPLKLGLDLDGVFYNFNDAFADVLARVTGKDRRPEGWTPLVWDWMSALGYTKSEVAAGWAAVDADPLWWTKLDPLPGAEDAIVQIAQRIHREQFQAVFLTTRYSPTAHWQSIAWVQYWGFHHYASPQVCICANAESKGLMAKALGLGIVLDDYAPNLLAVKRHSPETRVVVLDRPWNSAPLDRAGLRALGHESVPDLPGFLMLVDAALKERS